MGQTPWRSHCSFSEHFAKQGGTFRLKVLLMPNGHLYSRVCRLADEFSSHISSMCMMSTCYPTVSGCWPSFLAWLGFIFCIKEEEPLWKVIVRRAGSVTAFMIYDVLRLASTLGYSGRIRSIVSSHCRDIVGEGDVSLVGLVSGSCPHRQDWNPCPCNLLLCLKSCLVILIFLDT